VQTDHADFNRLFERHSASSSSAPRNAAAKRPPAETVRIPSCFKTHGRPRVIAETGASVRRCTGNRYCALRHGARRVQWPTRISSRTDQILLINRSGRGDNDAHTVAEKSGLKF
jgi:tryptophan synthase beta subunit